MQSNQGYIDSERFLLFIFKAGTTGLAERHYGGRYQGGEMTDEDENDDLDSKTLLEILR